MIEHTKSIGILSYLMGVLKFMCSHINFMQLHKTSMSIDLPRLIIGPHLSKD